MSLLKKITAKFRAATPVTPEKAAPSPAPSAPPASSGSGARPAPTASSASGARPAPPVLQRTTSREVASVSGAAPGAPARTTSGSGVQAYKPGDSGITASKPMTTPSRSVPQAPQDKSRFFMALAQADFEAGNLGSAEVNARLATTWNPMSTEAKALLAQVVAKKAQKA